MAEYLPAKCKVQVDSKERTSRQNGGSVHAAWLMTSAVSSSWAAGEEPGGGTGSLKCIHGGGRLHREPAVREGAVCRWERLGTLEVLVQALTCPARVVYQEKVEGHFVGEEMRGSLIEFRHCVQFLASS